MTLGAMKTPHLWAINPTNPISHKTQIPVKNRAMKLLGLAICAILTFSTVSAPAQESGSITLHSGIYDYYYYPDSGGTLQIYPDQSGIVHSGSGTLQLTSPQDGSVTIEDLNLLLPNGPGNGNLVLWANGSPLNWSEDTGWQFVQAVPEPVTWLLLALAATALLVRHKLRRAQS